MTSWKRRSQLKKLFLLAPSFILLATWFILAGTSDKVDPFVFEELNRSERTRLIIHLKEKADLSTSGFVPDWNDRGYWVYYALREVAERTQAPLIDLLKTKMDSGKAHDIQPYWICNCLAVTVDRDTVLELAERADVERVSANRKVRLIEPEDVTEANNEPPSVEWNISLIGADQVWNKYGITGRGVTIGNMDTGVNWTHPALQSKYRGWRDGQVDHNYNWIDATPSGRREPYDSSVHGTHTMGTIVGDDGAGNQIGVAPGAQWIAALIIGRDLLTWIESAHRGFQWMLAPTDLDGLNPDPSKRPSVVNNSWGCTSGITGCSLDLYDEFWDDINAWIGAGIVPEVSAGNEGMRGLRWPADYPQSFATGATDRNDNIARFSSRGPSQYDGSVKPNISAPGVNVRSSLPNNRYGLMSGTSMAGPHVVGLVALLLEANPYLSVNEIETIIQDTAVPLGQGRPNNDYGWGRIDALAAVEAALGMSAHQTANNAVGDGQKPAK